MGSYLLLLLVVAYWGQFRKQSSVWGHFISLLMVSTSASGCFDCIIILRSLTIWSQVRILMNNAISYLYIFAVFPSSSGMAISGAVVGYVTGICEKNDIMIQLLIEQTDMKILCKFLLYWIKQIVLIFHIWNKYPLPSTSTFLNSRDTRKISFYGHFIFL